jgi:multicomponent Na+:H+ antiporter subunit D
VGFITKWYLVMAIIENGWWPIAVLILLGSLLAIAYLWRIVEVAYFKEPAEGSARVSEAPLSILIPVWILIIANLYFGVDTRLTVGVAESAATGLFGVMP